MGILTVTTHKVFHHPISVVYDCASNPNNWSRNYSHSERIATYDEIESKLPLKFGDTFTEPINLGQKTFHLDFTVITQVRPWKFVVQVVDGLGRLADGTGGVEGIFTLSYTFEEVGEQSTLFRRELSCETKSGVSPPEAMLGAMANPGGADRFMDNIEKSLDEKYGRG